ncbi:MAG: hypothetical protein GWN77_12330, partial [Gammaproteobacteria bacterium]|nr:hypothetical protein [Gammaproteobacteria bacterium]
IPVKFTGRVASCLEVHRGGRTFYNVGIEFKEMTDSGRINLEEYLKYIQESLV